MKGVKKQFDKDENTSVLAGQIGERVANIFNARGYCCSESIVMGLNSIFRVGIAEELALTMGTGFCHGMGGAGCVCGALAGSEIILGILLGWRGGSGLTKKEFEALSKEMHDRFKARFHATCCRLLRKRRKEKKGASCQELTKGAAEIVVDLMLETKPELAHQIDHDFLSSRDSKAARKVSRSLGRA